MDLRRPAVDRRPRFSSPRSSPGSRRKPIQNIRRDCDASSARSSSRPPRLSGPKLIESPHQRVPVRPADRRSAGRHGGRARDERAETGVAVRRTLHPGERRGRADAPDRRGIADCRARARQCTLRLDRRQRLQHRDVAPALGLLHRRASAPSISAPGCSRRARDAQQLVAELTRVRLREKDILANIKSGIVTVDDDRPCCSSRIRAPADCSASISESLLGAPVDRDDPRRLARACRIARSLGARPAERNARRR